MNDVSGAASAAGAEPAGAGPGELLPLVLGRRLQTAGTGVEQYGRVLQASLRGCGAHPMLLDETRSRRSDVARQVRAAMPGARLLERDGDRLFRPDAFREAQTRFRRWRRLLTLRAPGPPGLVHWTYPVPMRIAGWRNLYTVHDVIPLDRTVPSPVNGRRLQRLLQTLAETADALVTVSETSRAAILDTLGCRPALVFNTWQAVDVAKVAAGPLPAGLRSQSYFVFVGRIEQRKNLLRLIAAHQRSGTATQLVLAGPDGHDHGPIDAAVARQAGVVRVGFLPRPELLQLVKHARALLLPSLAEGFGLPVAEGMALGVPVLTSARGALAEVAADAALLVDPESIDALADAIRRLDGSPDLRRTLAAAGVRQAQVFGQADYGKRLLDLYRKITHA